MKKTVVRCTNNFGYFKVIGPFCFTCEAQDYARKMINEIEQKYGIHYTNHNDECFKTDASIKGVPDFIEIKRED